MRGVRFGSILSSLALAGAMGLAVGAAPAGATVACPAGGSFPNSPGAQSNLKVDCTTSAGTKATSIVIHDAANAEWHSGAARIVKNSVAAAAGASSLTFAAGTVTQSDVRRPISGFNALNASFVKGATFITAITPAACTTACTGATLSQPLAAAAPVQSTFLIEQSTNRVLVDASCTAAVSLVSTLTSPSAHFVAGDVNKSVTGGPFKLGAKITSITSATQAKVTSTAANAVCTDGNATVAGVQDTITLGAQQCAAGAGCTPALTPDPTTRELHNSPGPPVATGFSCVAGSHTLTSTTAGGGFVAANSDAGLQVVITGTATVTTKITANTTTAATLLGTCPAGVTATVGTGVIGVPNANAPTNGAAMMSLAAELNLNPALVATQDDCASNTYEGFEVIGAWQNPGAYTGGAVIGGTGVIPPLSTGQVVFPTSVISFQGFVVPFRGSDGVQTVPHTNFTFPSLPTTLAVCTTAGNPTNASALAFGIIPTPLAGAPFLPTGSGNPGAPGIRSIDSRTGPFGVKVQVFNGTTSLGTFSPPACTIPANTATPTFGSCGDG